LQVNLKEYKLIVWDLILFGIENNDVSLRRKSIKITSMRVNKSTGLYPEPD
jgi:hypothetical protein